MVRSNGSRHACCYVSEMLEELGVTRAGVLQTRKVILRAIKALIEAELEHIARTEKKSEARRRSRDPSQRPRRGPTAVPVAGFESRRGA